MPIKMVVFDMAGTTVEDNDNVHSALISAMQQHNYAIDREDANSVMGIPKPVAIRELLERKFSVKENIGTLVAQIHEAFVKEMIRFYKTDARVCEKRNASETFRALKARGIKVCIDTGFSRDIADAIIERLGWKEDNLIDLSITSDEVTNGRPFPDMIFRAMQLTGIHDPDEVAKVGDTVSDLKEGTSANCQFVIGITTGAYTAEQLQTEAHTHLIDDLLQVASIVTTD